MEEDLIILGCYLELGGPKGKRRLISFVPVIRYWSVGTFYYIYGYTYVRTICHIFIGVY